MSEAQPTTYARRMAVLREVGRMLAEARDLRKSLPDVLARIAAYDGWERSAFFFAGDPAPAIVAEVLATSEPIKRPTETGRVLAFPVFGGAAPTAVVVLETAADGTVEVPERGMLESLGQMLGLCIERMRVEGELRASELRLREVVQSLDEGVIVIEDGRIVYWNPRAQAALGFADDTAGWMRTQRDPKAWHVTTLDGAPIDRLPSARIAAGETMRGSEFWVSRPDTGWRRALRYSGTRVIQADGRPLVVIGISDVTDRVELEQQLERRVDERTAELERTNQDLDAFAAAVSHDLRAPIRAIVAFARALQEDHALAADAHGLAQRIERNGERLRALVTDILALARNRTGSLEREDIDVDAMVRDILGELSATGDVQLGALGHCAANRTLIRQVWTNLIDNALKYSRTRPRREIRIARRDDADRVAFSVTDNGVGFDQARAELLFGAFQRLHPASEFEGTGIGLANVRRIVERHGGRVSARGVVGEGSTFEFSLPR